MRAAECGHTHSMKSNMATSWRVLAVATLVTAGAIATTTSSSSAATEHAGKVAEQSPSCVDSSRITVWNLTDRPLPVASSWEDYNDGKTLTLKPGGKNSHMDQGHNKGAGLSYHSDTEFAAKYLAWKSGGVDATIVLGKGRYICAHNPHDGDQYVAGAQFSSQERPANDSQPPKDNSTWTFTSETTAQRVSEDFTYTVTYRNAHKGYKCWDVYITKFA